MKKNRAIRKKATNNIDEESIWDSMPKFIKVHIVSNGIFTICQATTKDGVTEYYNWDKASDRKTVRKLVDKDAEIIVDDNVFKGWDYNG